MITGVCWPAWPWRAARSTRTAEDMARLDLKCRAEKLEPGLGLESEPRLPRHHRQDGTTHLTYKRRKSGGSGSIRPGLMAAELHPADQGRHDDAGHDAGRHPRRILLLDTAPTVEDPAECVTVQGYRSRSVLNAARRRPLEFGLIPSLLAENCCALTRAYRGGPPGSHQQPDPGRHRAGQGSHLAERRDRQALLCAQPRVTAAFAGHGCPSAEIVHKRYLLHVAWPQSAVACWRKLIGAGKPREAVAGGTAFACLLLSWSRSSLRSVLIVSEDGETAFVA